MASRVGIQAVAKEHARMILHSVHSTALDTLNRLRMKSAERLADAVPPQEPGSRQTSSGFVVHKQAASSDSSKPACRNRSPIPRPRLVAASPRPTPVKSFFLSHSPCLPPHSLAAGTIASGK